MHSKSSKLRLILIAPLIEAVVVFWLVTLLITTRVVGAGNHSEHRHAVVVTVKGMGCPFCVYGLKKHLVMLYRV